MSTFTIPKNNPHESREIGESWKPRRIAVDLVFQGATLQGKFFLFDDGGAEVRCEKRFVRVVRPRFSSVKLPTRLYGRRR